MFQMEFSSTKSIDYITQKQYLEGSHTKMIADTGGNRIHLQVILQEDITISEGIDN